MSETVDVSEPASTLPAQDTLKGNVENFDGRFLSGWASDGTAKPLRLHVIVDGELYCDIDADRPRNDVMAAGMAIIGSGFAIEIPRAFFEETGCDVEIVDEKTGRKIFGSPFHVKARPKRSLENATDLNSFTEVITSITEKTSDARQLQANIASLLGWLQRSVDRARALKETEAVHFEKLNEAISDSGGLGGSLVHLYGILQNNYPQILLPERKTPCVSIIIPVHNKFELTYNCIRSIEAAKTKVSFEIVLVDDGSSDETLLASLVFLGEATVVRTLRNEGFVGACNTGLARARGQYVLFLNNDTIVNDGWLDALCDTLDRDPRIGVVGSRLLFADGVLQEAGGIIWRDGSGWNWGRGQDKMHPTYSFMRDADYVSGAALMIRRDLLRELKGFDELYAPAYYEDTDLCFRARAAGYRVVVQPKSTIIHLEGQSNGTDLSTGLKRYQAINAKKFRDRWAKTLSSHRLNGEMPAREAERSVKRRALFIDETTPTPDQDAGSNAILEHMLSFQRLGYKIVFLPAGNMAHIPKYSEELQALGIECWYAPYAWSVEEYFRKNDCNFEVVYIHRKANVLRYLHVVQKYAASASIMFNYADIHALREMREAKLTAAAAKTLKAIERDLQDELDLATQVDAVIVHSTFESDLIKKERPDACVHYVPWTIETISTPAVMAERSGIAFVGGYGHPPNADAVDWFVKEVWPLVTESMTEHAFKIVGSRMPERFNDLRGSTIDPIGFVDDLAELLDGLILTVAPLRFGAGLKGKVLYSFARGVPCVMSPIAAEGLDLPEDLRHLVANEPAEYTKEITALVNDADFWKRTSDSVLKFVQERFSQDVIDRLLKDTIKDAKRRS